MSFWPEGFDPSADAVGFLTLIVVETEEGPFGFMPGVDGMFTDINGVIYWGSTLLSVPTLKYGIQGTAPEGALTMTFFQNPDAPDLISQLRAQGLSYVEGREVRFYVQPINSQAEFSAPTMAPILFAVRTSARLSFEANGAVQRRITLEFEGPFAGRNEASKLVWSTADHSALWGAANPSLQYMPNSNFEEQKLWG